ncbi:hypothetical protein C0Q70_15683 [Pomacea canaliculata]|uniref:Uncharacterized protein n=1 Tax=Pomacea canaliculata TaxID=400727 RepID=A0A2T7NVJ8_POMCA|nr:hypothetical protein C0Q70_15683 [Pomacea canaliculata]
MATILPARSDGDPGLWSPGPGAAHNVVTPSITAQWLWGHLFLPKALFPFTLSMFLLFYLLSFSTCNHAHACPRLITQRARFACIQTLISASMTPRRATWASGGRIPIDGLLLLLLNSPLVVWVAGASPGTCLGGLAETVVARQVIVLKHRDFGHLYIDSLSDPASPLHPCNPGSRPPPRLNGS